MVRQLATTGSLHVSLPCPSLGSCLFHRSNCPGEGVTILCIQSTERSSQCFPEHRKGRAQSDTSSTPCWISPPKCRGRVETASALSPKSSCSGGSTGGCRSCRWNNTWHKETNTRSSNCWLAIFHPCLAGVQSDTWDYSRRGTFCL